MDLKQKESHGVDHVDVATMDDSHLQPPEASTLPWFKQTELRKLYFMMVFLFLGSTTLGYDGSLLNGLQTMQSWQTCKLNFMVVACCDYACHNLHPLSISPKSVY